MNRMENFPKEVIILGLPYKIEIVDKKIEVDISKEKPLLGQIEFDSSSIRIFNNNSTYESSLQVLLHEILHALSLYLDLNLKERQVGALAIGLLDILKSNKLI